MIKNIIFDLGGVILNIDFQRSATEFKDIGIDNFNQLYSRAVQESLFEKLEMGLITDKSFYNEIRKLSKLPITDQQIEKAWNALILDFPQKRLALLQEIGRNYRCFLLSNTNGIHYTAYQNDLREKHSIDGLESLFEKSWYSHKLQMRKPNKDIFTFALSDAAIEAKDTLFIDDSIQNIETAKSLGIKTLFIDISKGKEIAHYFTNGKITNDEASH